MADQNNLQSDELGKHVVLTLVRDNVRTIQRNNRLCVCFT